MEVWGGFRVQGLGNPSLHGAVQGLGFSSTSKSTEHLVIHESFKGLAERLEKENLCLTGWGLAPIECKAWVTRSIIKTPNIPFNNPDL